MPMSADRGDTLLLVDGTEREGPIRSASKHFHTIFGIGRVRFYEIWANRNAMWNRSAMSVDFCEIHLKDTPDTRLWDV